jgi:hypothetical protein
MGATLSQTNPLARDGFIRSAEHFDRIADRMIRFRKDSGELRVPRNRRPARPILLIAAIPGSSMRRSRLS